AELGIDTDDLTSPWHAAWASMLAFTLGAALPLLTITLLPPDLRSAGTVVAVAVALALTGFWSARFVGANVARARTRVIVGGLLAMGVTSLIGTLVGAGVP